jgi:hypothetical protein
VALYSLILEIEQMVFGVRAAHGHVTVSVHLVPGFGSCPPNTMLTTTKMRLLQHYQ